MWWLREEIDEERDRTCPECGELVERGSVCHNPECDLGAENNAMDYGDYLYHSNADREAEAYFEGRN